MRLTGEYVDLVPGIRHLNSFQDEIKSAFDSFFTFQRSFIEVNKTNFFGS